MKIKKFKNGNISVKFENKFDMNGTLGADDLTDFIILLCNSSELDFVAPDEVYPRCLGNFHGYIPLYNANNCLFYDIMDYMTSDFFKGKTVKLYGMDAMEEYKDEFKNVLGDE